MTPAARIAAAIGILDQILDGKPAEAALIGWSRSSRFAGSKDRAAVRDHVFDALRCRRSFSALGGAETCRGLMIGALRAQGSDPDGIFTGEGHAPSTLTEEERGYTAPELSDAERLDWPDWLWPIVQTDLGQEAEAALAAMQQRGPVFLRVNRRRGDVSKAIALLSEDGVGAVPHASVAGCLIVTENPRRVQASAAMTNGLIELQDASSQRAMLALPQATKVLDYCAGGGGKSLALADRGCQVFAHDIQPDRMSDIPVRAKRAGFNINVTTKPNRSGPYDLVLCDAPCTGSGTWRRTPDAKWRLTQDRLSELTQIQASILSDVHTMVAEGGTLAYATCSILTQENRQVVDRFIAAHSEWDMVDELRLLPSDQWDGFYLAQLKRR